ncbi:MAG: hypothetical protein DDT19_00858 [Syntrophomonadaceae bacterium]|nr:hypothetical protein [Bacillota bacterium]
MNNEEFIREMLEFKGRTEQALSDIRADIGEVKSEMKDSVERLWIKMDDITVHLHSTNTEIQVIKGKASMIAGLTAFFTSAFITIVGWFVVGKDK